MRAQGIAGTPVLRAAIETDQATVADLASNEVVFSPAKGETIEVFQSGKSLVRLPKDAEPIKPVQQAQETRLELRGDSLIVVASAPIAGAKTVAGSLAIARSVDLNQIKQTVGKAAAHAVLTGLEHDVPLVGGAPTGGLVRVSIPLSSEWGIAPLTLAASASPVAPMSWIAPVRYACVGSAALFLLLYVVGLRRSRG
jgi:hypothetical protein